MANVKQQAENCIALFKGTSISTIERGLKACGKIHSKVVNYESYR